jgi:hypothetical protein
VKWSFVAAKLFRGGAIIESGLAPKRFRGYKKDMSDIQRQRVTSSDIASIGYDEATETLEIEFHATGVYRYFSVSKSVADEFRASPSPGKYFLQNIKGKYAWERAATFQ